MTSSGEIYRGYNIEVRAGIATVKVEGKEYEFDKLEDVCEFIDGLKLAVHNATNRAHREYKQNKAR